MILINFLYREGLEQISWTDTLQRTTSSEYSHFNLTQQLWPNSEQIEKNTNEQFVSQQHDSFSEINSLKTNSFVEDDGFIQPGTYTYYLKWTLPTNLPSEYEDSSLASWVSLDGSWIPKMLSKESNKISYFGTAMLELDKNAEETICKSAYFKVVEDFPMSIMTKDSLIYSAEKTFMFSNDCPLKLTLSVANGGIVFCGNNLFLTISISNKSSRIVDSFKLTLESVTTLKSEDSSLPNLVKKENVVSMVLQEFNNVVEGEERNNSVLV